MHCSHPFLRSSILHLFPPVHYLILVAFAIIHQIFHFAVPKPNFPKKLFCKKILPRVIGFSSGFPIIHCIYFHSQTKDPIVTIHFIRTIIVTTRYYGQTVFYLNLIFFSPASIFAIKMYNFPS